MRTGLCVVVPNVFLRGFFSEKRPRRAQTSNQSVRRGSCSMKVSEKQYLGSKRLIVGKHKVRNGGNDKGIFANKA